MAKEQTESIRIRRSDKLRIQKYAKQNNMFDVDVINEAISKYLFVTVPVIGKLNKKTLLGEIGKSSEPIEEKYMSMSDKMLLEEELQDRMSGDETLDEQLAQLHNSNSDTKRDWTAEEILRREA